MLAPRKHPIFALLVIAADAAAIFLGFFCAYWIRFSGVIIPIHKGIPSFEVYFRAVFFLLPFYFVIFRSYRLYQPERQVRRIQELLTVVKAVTVGTFFAMALTFFYREFSYSRIVFLFAWIFSVLFCCSCRYLLIQIEYFIRRHRDRDRVLIIGLNRHSRDLIEWSKNNLHYGQDVVGILAFEESQVGKHADGVPILGSYQNLDQVLDGGVDEVVVADSFISRDKVAEIMLKCENRMIGFKLVADFYGLMTHYVNVEYVSNVPLLGLKSLPLDDGLNRVAKRFFDIVIASTALCLLSPAFFLIMILIKLTSPGPVFYKQERLGLNGKSFWLLKFRTMGPNAEVQTGPVWANPDDERVTPLGRILRRTNVDELPQFWNVLAGDMSLVGPRPERPHFVEQFRGQIPRYMARHKIKAGMTGWAQIHGLRGNTSLEERIKFDLYYMENWTLAMDIEILFATLFAFKNAY